VQSIQLLELMVIVVHSSSLATSRGGHFYLGETGHFLTWACKGNEPVCRITLTGGFHVGSCFVRTEALAAAAQL
jgi:hypothetical protein